MFRSLCIQGCAIQCINIISIYHARSRTIFTQSRNPVLSVHPVSRSTPTSVYNRDQNICGIIGIGRRRYGFGFGDWDNIEKIFKPAPDKDPEEINRRLIRKFQREAAKAGFTSPFIRKSSMPITARISTKRHHDRNQYRRADHHARSRAQWCGKTTYRSFCEAVKTARRSIRVGLISAATTVRYGWSLAIRTMAITGLGT